MLVIDLVKHGRVLMVIYRVFNTFASSLNVHIAYQYLLAVEARDGEDRRRRLDQRFSS